MTRRAVPDGVRRALVLTGMVCACGEPVAPVGPNEVRIPKTWSECFAGQYEPAQDGLPVVLRLTQTMPDFELRAVCVTVESRVVAAGDSRDVTPQGLERRLTLAPGNHTFLLSFFVAPHMPGYKFEVRSSHVLEAPPGSSWALTAHFSEAARAAINERPRLEWQEERRSQASSGDAGVVGDDGGVSGGD